MSEELKPCELCSEAAELMHASDADFDWFYVRCCCCFKQSATFDTAEEARAAWNRRVAPQWTKEPPTEQGYYWVLEHTTHTRTKKNQGNPVPRIVVARVFYSPDSTSGRRLMVYAHPWRTDFEIEEYVDFQNQLYQTLPLWLKIDVPATLEESEGTP